MSASITVVLGHPSPPIRGSQEASPRLSGKRLAKSSGQVCQEPSFKHLGSGQETEMPHHSDGAPQVSLSQADPGSKQATYPQPCQSKTWSLHVRQGGVQSRLLHACLRAGGPVENLSQRKGKLRGGGRPQPSPQYTQVSQAITMTGAEHIRANPGAGTEQTAQASGWLCSAH